MMVGIRKDGVVEGMRIISNTETPGLGVNAAQPKFYERFSNQKAERFSVSKTPTETSNVILALSGATITTSAVVKGVNEAVDYFRENLAGRAAQ